MSTGRNEQNSALEKIKSGDLSIEGIKHIFEEINPLVLSEKIDKEQAEKIYMEIVKNYLKKYPIVLFSIPEDYRTHEICKECVIKMPGFLPYLPPHELHNSEIVTLAVSKNGQSLEHVPLDMRDEKLCILAVTNSKLALPYVPDKFLNEKDEGVIGSAIKKNREIAASYGLLELLPVKLRDIDTCISAIKSDWKYLKLVPDKILENKKFIGSEEYKNAIANCKEAVKKDWREIKHVPEKLIKSESEFELALKTFQKTIEKDWSIRNVPEALLTKEICLQVINFNSDIINTFNSIPKRFCDFEICKTAMKRSGFFEGLIIGQLNNYREKTVLSKDNYNELCLLAIKSNVDNFNEIQIPNRDIELCLKLVRNCDEKVLIKILSKMWDYSKATVLSTKNFIEVLSVAIERKSEVLDAIPLELLTPEFCMALVNMNGKFLQKISQNIDNLHITEMQYAEICRAAVNQNADALAFVPDKYHDLSLCMSAVSKQGLSLLSIRKYGKDAALSEEDYKKVLIAAVQNNPLVLKYVSKDYIQYVVDQVSPEKILKANYSASKYFPAEPKYKAIIDDYLANIEHIVVSNDRGQDREIGDSYNDYAEKDTRKGKCIYCQSEDLEDLLKHLAQIGNSKNLNLVLLGHASRDSKDLAGFTPNDIVPLVKNYPTLTRVTLLGCHTGVAKQLIKEKEMIEKYRNSLKKPCGLVLTSNIPDTKTCVKLLESLSYDKNGLEAKEVYVLINCSTKDSEQYKLMHIQQPNDPDTKSEPQATLIDITPDQVIRIAKKVLGNSNGKINFPGKKSQDIHYRGGTSNAYLTSHEINTIFDVISNSDQVDKFSKKHPKYKEHKNIYTHMASATIDQKEYDKLLDSLQKKIIDKIQADPDIDREINVKGYTQLVHADNVEKQMKSGPYFYTSAYKKAANKSTFYKDVDNIDRKELKTYHDKLLADMESGKASEDSHLKSIKFKTTPLKKR